MPTLIGHSIIAFGLINFRPQVPDLLKIILLSLICACIPDVDVIGFRFGIHYSDALGHRGFSHSLLFALLFSFCIVHFFYRSCYQNKFQFVHHLYYFFIVTCSHGLFDAMTDGGKGVGFFIPFNEERYFLPFRPIPVCSFDVMALFTSYGLQILQSELKFILFISLILFVAGFYWRKMTEQDN